jgi:hypothetical protein
MTKVLLSPIAFIGMILGGAAAGAVLYEILHML